jgi:D-alanine-D-alanine ligase
VALIYGGRSGEHEISLRSAESVKRALDPAKYELSEYLITKEGKWQPKALIPEPNGNPGIDVAFPMLHGTFGEDGTVQGLLELAELPYVGAGVLASAVSMDKITTKKLCQQAGLPVVDFIVLIRGAFDPKAVSLPFAFPVFVKPANLGSSVGITKAKNCCELAHSLEIAARYDRKIIIERGIQGREFECAVLGGSAQGTVPAPPNTEELVEPLGGASSRDRCARAFVESETIASVPCEIKPSQEFYTYEDTYLLDQARIDLPANLSSEQISLVKQLALTCFDAVGCEGMARVDFLMETATGEFFINEINTIPGFTSISMYPKMWEYSGIPYPELVDRLIELAFQRAQARRETQYSR